MQYAISCGPGTLVDHGECFGPDASGAFQFLPAMSAPFDAIPGYTVLEIKPWPDLEGGETLILGPAPSPDEDNTREAMGD